MQNIDESELLQCPYDTSHLILPTRFQVHLGRCRRNYKGARKVTCPFNTCHVLNEPELDYHVSVCPQRSAFEIFKHREEAATKHESSSSVIPVLETESGNWDDEPDTVSYNPQTYASNAQVLRSIQGAAPSERKEFRKQERKRLLGIKN